MNNPFRFILGTLIKARANALPFVCFLSFFLLCCGASPKNDSLDNRTKKLLALLAIDQISAPKQEVVVWTEDHNGHFASTWLLGNGAEISFAATVPTLIIPKGEALWEWQTIVEPIPLCDCQAWAVQEHRGDCPTLYASAELMQAQLVDRVTTAQVELTSISEQFADEDVQFGEFHADITPVSLIGPYLFVQYGRESVGCTPSHHSKTNGFLVFDLENRESITILSDAEKEKLIEVEQNAAFGLMQSDRLLHVNDASDIALTLIEPRYDPFSGITVSYGFSYQTLLNTRDDAQAALYSRTIQVPATTIPQALTPYASIPPVVAVFALNTPNTILRGWALVEGTPENRAILRAAFLSE